MGGKEVGPSKLGQVDMELDQLRRRNCFKKYNTIELTRLNFYQFGFDEWRSRVR